MKNSIPITSSELGVLWTTYQRKTMMINMMEYFIEKSEDRAAKKIMINYCKENNKFVVEIEDIFKDEGAIVPSGFNEKDVHKDAKPLFDNMFAILFLRLMMKLSSGLNALHLDMTYRKDIRDFFKRSSTSSQEIFDACTEYLLEKGVLARSPYVTMPKEGEFVGEKNFMKGIKLFGDKRPLNTVEVAHIYQSIEGHIIETHLLTGFAQVAKENDVRDHFMKGKELTKKIVSDLGSLLQQSDIQSPSTWAGRPTDSTEPPFSDKLMMYCSTTLAGFQLTSNALGIALSLRSDLPLKLTLLSQDVYQFANKGGQLMVKHHWMEEPPQMEDRNHLIKSKK
ncbi:hypothetical protein BKP45_00455 [Anaerobacillus alkalidiazotrophicus]|uniref:DUF3231 family protein n=1 Tax=Anaerobacillus alkalidiazotrophicus TaxID=472963 RepID=A0A1S2M9A4_9BACI|nr:DUF3231 family protein [Anaerobacillus alkalidiazotrophicus]OIJ21289.1 hypothetical protein BKP45_00455 [Anaerobacillus alkalidiazotrophicus]